MNNKIYYCNLFLELTRHKKNKLLLIMTIRAFTNNYTKYQKNKKYLLLKYNKK